MNVSRINKIVKQLNKKISLYADLINYRDDLLIIGFVEYNKGQLCSDIVAMQIDNFVDINFLKMDIDLNIQFMCETFSELVSENE